MTASVVSLAMTLDPSCPHVPPIITPLTYVAYIQAALKFIEHTSGAILWFQMGTVQNFPGPTGTSKKKEKKSLGKEGLN